jgi:hypothetical protein
MCHDKSMSTNPEMAKPRSRKAVALSDTGMKPETLEESMQRRERIGILRFFGAMELHPPFNDKVRMVKQERSRSILESDQ